MREKEKKRHKKRIETPQWSREENQRKRGREKRRHKKRIETPQ